MPDLPLDERPERDLMPEGRDGACFAVHGRPGLAGSVRSARSQPGYRPRAVRSRRSTTRLSRLSFNTRAVAIPSGVSGSITAPRSRKWSSQRWRRGWKKLTSAPLRGSTVPMSLPFHVIASNAGIREVAGIRRSDVLTTYDVVDLMRRIRIVFMKKAILTAIRGAFCHESAQ